MLYRSRSNPSFSFPSVHLKAFKVSKHPYFKEVKFNTPLIPTREKDTEQLLGGGTMTITLPSLTPMKVKFIYSVLASSLEAEHYLIMNKKHFTCNDRLHMSVVTTE